ncbi:MAG: methylated-DNA--[protein]-cysteine S-methyltransferase, partial [Bacillota bacterium]
NNKFILSIKFVNKNKEANENKLTKLAKKQLNEYFTHKRKEFNLPIKLEGTDFQKKVWKELMNIEFGKTNTYKEISLKINKPKAYRAVGNASSKNGFLIIIPCHRVISSNGTIGGYNAGIEKKRWLIIHEKKFN